MANVTSETSMHFIVVKICTSFRVLYSVAPGINTGIQFEGTFVQQSNCMFQLSKYLN